jgi:RNA polymerase sigma-70 factor (ECF subfamily)
MYLVAFRYLQNRFAAEEVIGNAFLKIFRGLVNFHDEGEVKFQAWMRKIVVNESLMEIRRIKQMPVFTNEMPETISPASLGERSYFDDLLLLVDRLPEGYRLVFKLYVIEGYSHAEVADLLQISEGTSKSQLHKARLQLQQLLIKTQSYG